MALFAGVDLNQYIYWTKINKAVQLSTKKLVIYIPKQSYSAWLKTRYNKAALSIRSFAQRLLSYDDDQVGTKSAADSLFIAFHMLICFRSLCLAAVVYRDIDCFREDTTELWTANSLSNKNLTVKFCLQI